MLESVPTSAFCPERFCVSLLSVTGGSIPTSRRSVVSSGRCLSQFLTKNYRDRLGCTPDGEARIKDHPFFAGIDWVKLEQRKLEPPFKPVVKSKKAANNFDSDFTSEAPVLTPTTKERVEIIDQEEFTGFTFVNTEFVNSAS